MQDIRKNGYEDICSWMRLNSNKLYYMYPKGIIKGENMVYDSMSVRIEHEKVLNNTHKMYCPKCNSFVIGKMTDGGILKGYNRICPTHGEI